jgi:ribose transport system permease protein
MERSAFRNVLSAFSFTRISGVYVWIGLLILFAFWIPDTFFVDTTWKNIVSSQAVTAILTLGLLLPLAAGVYDLSIGSMLGLSAIFSAYLVNHGASTGAAVLIVLGVAVVVGLFNAFLVVGMGINSFIATLGVGTILTAAIGEISGNQQIIGLPDSFKEIGGAEPFGIPIPVIYLVVLAGVVWYLMERAPFGRYLFAIGNGREAARLAGVRTNVYAAIALVLCAIGAAIAGIVLTGKLGAASPEQGPSYLLPAYAAAFLGATQIHRGRVNVIGMLIATYLLQTGITGLQLGGAEFWVADLFNGVALILALVISQLSGRFGSWNRRWRRAPGPPSTSSDRVPSTTS